MATFTVDVPERLIDSHVDRMLSKMASLWGTTDEALESRYERKLATDSLDARHERRLETSDQRNLSEYDVTIMAR